jgi:hypothetical protein
MDPASDHSVKEVCRCFTSEGGALTQLLTRRFVRRSPAIPVLKLCSAAQPLCTHKHGRGSRMSVPGGDME